MFFDYLSLALSENTTILVFGDHLSALHRLFSEQDRRPCEPSRGVEVAETSANDDDALELRVCPNDGRYTTLVKKSRSRLRHPVPIGI